jgi:alkylhydroperoxidase/carboxymuconolactone decarboxylase family protein YurZ
MPPDRTAVPPTDLPVGASRIAKGFTDVWEAYAGLGEACAEAGPLDERTRRLIKLALALAAGSEGDPFPHSSGHLVDTRNGLG